MKRKRWVENPIDWIHVQTLNESVPLHCVDWMLVHDRYAPASWFNSIFGAWVILGIVNQMW